MNFTVLTYNQTTDNVFSTLKQMLKSPININNIFNFLKTQNINIHQLLTSIDPNILDQQTVYTLINEGILDVYKRDVAYGNNSNFKNYINHIDESLLVSILDRIELEKDEYKINQTILNKIETIKKIQDFYELHKYICKNPEDIYLAMVWCSWNSFNTSFVNLYITNGILNPFKIRPEFDGVDIRNINFLQHLQILEKEFRVNSVRDIGSLLSLKDLIKNIKSLKDN